MSRFSNDRWEPIINITSGRQKIEVGLEKDTVERDANRVCHLVGAKLRVDAR